MTVNCDRAGAGVGHRGAIVTRLSAGRFAPDAVCIRFLQKRIESRSRRKRGGLGEAAAHAGPDILFPQDIRAGERPERKAKSSHRLHATRIELTASRKGRVPGCRYGQAETTWTVENELAYLSRLREVKAEEVQAAARKYFGDDYARVRFVPQGGGR